MGNTILLFFRNLARIVITIPQKANAAVTRAMITATMRMLFWSVAKLLSRIVFVVLTESDLARSRRTFAKCALAELRMATASERKAKNKVARRVRITWSEDIVEVEGCR